ncbi:hypothetical protein Aab01nite_74210 [Paractinoplanes abujensis]|uniref:CBM2 domain-containing protein n=1 Tax=Paractinoplanes abujensis TaxID=882441 RepID=A0A7W7CUV8_9ACTN|nr:cellulose binding domain-containing protein [Actinoplanes abujensis]MBB4695099.1 hypothetical protein [Actinoplanes abujensis]GID23831.1 hypothetical protein Aab01nite_74210 [Actinoplanes abujensis]
MAAKHSVRVFGTARFILSSGAAILVLLVMWIAMRAVGPAEAANPPVQALPSPPRTTVAAPPPVISSTPSVSRAPSRTPSATPTRTRKTTSPAPSKTRPVVRTTPPPQTDVEATLSVGASWNEGYVAAVRVTNEGDRPVRWRVTVSHADLRNLALRGVWNASGNQQGESIVFSGGTLAPGAHADFGYQTSSSGRGKARPSACNALGGSCRVR